MAASSDIKEKETNINNPIPQQINIKVEPQDIESIDKEIEKIEKQYPGIQITRSEMARVILLRGLGKNG